MDPFTVLNVISSPQVARQKIHFLPIKPVVFIYMLYPKAKSSTMAAFNFFIPFF